jgi:hypothetical protein
VDNKEAEEGEGRDGSQCNKCLHIGEAVFNIVMKGANNKSASIGNHHIDGYYHINYYSN